MCGTTKPIEILDLDLQRKHGVKCLVPGLCLNGLIKMSQNEEFKIKVS